VTPPPSGPSLGSRGGDGRTVSHDTYREEYMSDFKVTLQMDWGEDKNGRPR